MSRKDYSAISYLVASFLLLYHPALSLQPFFSVDKLNGRLKDNHGRERIFHGVNVVFKAPPWHPNVKSFDPYLSFTAEDIAILRQLRMNVVRLAVMWPGVFPRRGQVNTTYLDVISSIVRQLSDNGIYSIIEMHQDVFASRFCGEGVPFWFLQEEETTPRHVGVSQKLLRKRLGEDKIGVSSSCHYPSRNCDKPWQYSVTFPEPLATRYPVEEVDNPSGEWEPSVAMCLTMGWGDYQFSFAVARAFQDLYDNKWGWGVEMENYWRLLAERFKDEPSVIGYELMNEPWVGDQYREPLLLIPGVADRKNLLPFFDKLQSAIRAVDSRHLIFFESVTFDNIRTGYNRVPGGDNWANMSVLSYHYYRPPNFGVEQAFQERMREASNLHCGAFLTEFGIPAEPSSSYEHRSSRLDIKKAVLLVKEDMRAKGRLDEFPSLLHLELEKPSGSNFVQNADDDLMLVLNEADKFAQSWAGWEYKKFVNITGSNYGLFYSDGSFNDHIGKMLSRTYPTAVAGTISSFSFDAETAVFTLSYIASTATREEKLKNALWATTEIWLSDKYYYPLGFEVVVHPTSVVSVGNGDGILLIHGEETEGATISVTIIPKTSVNNNIL